MTARADENRGTPPGSRIRTISAVTLATEDMARAVAFYTSLGFAVKLGGPDAEFTSLRAGDSFVNLFAAEEGTGEKRKASGTETSKRDWGRVIFHVDDVDAIHARTRALGYRPHFAPRDAEWGERYFHLTDPDGHELSFARPIRED